LLIRAADQAVGLGAGAEAAVYLETAADLETDPSAATELRARALGLRELVAVS
jgi:hypothetical protein